jgi:hypothetical protein
MNELKQYLKHLAMESGRLRRMENSPNLNLFTRQRKHRDRVVTLRRETRTVLLAYQYLRGVPYKRVEQKCKTKPDWDAVRKLVKPRTDDDRATFETWRLSDIINLSYLRWVERIMNTTSFEIPVQVPVPIPLMMPEPMPMPTPQNPGIHFIIIDK